MLRSLIRVSFRTAKYISQPHINPIKASQSALPNRYFTETRLSKMSSEKVEQASVPAEQANPAAPIPKAGEDKPATAPAAEGADGEGEGKTSKKGGESSGLVSGLC
jgi:hypothetical protein